MGVSGTQTSGLVFGGSPPVTTKTEAWNGTTWTEVNDLGAAREYGASSGSQDNTLGLYAGGQPPTGTPTAATEEWEAPDFEIKTVTTS